MTDDEILSAYERELSGGLRSWLLIVGALLLTIMAGAGLGTLLALS